MRASPIHLLLLLGACSGPREATTIASLTTASALEVDGVNAFVLEAQHSELSLDRVSLGDRTTSIMVPADQLLTTGTNIPIDDDFVYFAQMVGSQSAITRISKDGSTSQVVTMGGPLPTGTFVVGPLAVTTAWVYAFAGTSSGLDIVRAPKNGGAFETVAAVAAADQLDPFDPIRQLCSIVADDSKAYWSVVLDGTPPHPYTTTTVVGRANADGTNAQIVQARPVESESECTRVTMDNSSVYWWEFDIDPKETPGQKSALIAIDKKTDAIGRVTVDDTWLTRSPIRSDKSRLYWNAGSAIHAVPRRGGHPSTFIASGGGIITDVAVQGGNVYWLESTLFDASTGAKATQLKSAPTD